MYLAQMARYEPPDEVPAGSKVLIDTTSDLTAQIDAVTRMVAQAFAPAS